MSTSRAQSIVSSRKSSRRTSFDEEEGAMKVEESKDAQTGAKCVMSNALGAKVDDSTIVNDPGMFAAEQTWPTEDEMKGAKRKLSEVDQDEMQEMETEPVQLGAFKTGGD